MKLLTVKNIAKNVVPPLKAAFKDEYGSAALKDVYFDRFNGLSAVQDAAFNREAHVTLTAYLMALALNDPQENLQKLRQSFSLHARKPIDGEAQEFEVNEDAILRSLHMVVRQYLNEQAPSYQRTTLHDVNHPNLPHGFDPHDRPGAHAA